MSVALVSLWIALGAVVMTTSLAAALRGFGAIVGARSEHYRAKIAQQLAAYAVGAVDEPPSAPVGRLQQRVMHEELARLAPNLKGESRTLLAELFARYGLISSVMRDLHSEHPLTAIRAAELAGIMHASECVRILANRLNAEPLVRLACARALGELGAVQTMPLIVGALATDGNAIELGQILMGFGTSAEPLLRERVRVAEDGHERRLAAVALGELHAHGAVPELIVSMLEDPDPEVRSGAARALGKIGERSAGGALTLTLREAEPGFTAVAAATALGMLDDPSAAPALVRGLCSEDWEVRNACARALVALGEQGFWPVASRLNELTPAGIAHFAGVLDVADGLGAIVERAAGEDPDADRFIRAACASGVRSRLDELATSDGALGAYAAGVLSLEGVSR